MSEEHLASSRPARRAHLQRDGRFTDFGDFIRSVDLPVCNKRAVDSLIRAGAFDSLGHTRRGLCAVAESVIDVVTPVKKAAEIGQDDLFGMAPEVPEFRDHSMEVGSGVDIEEWPRKILLATEREMLGLYVSGHPLDGMEPTLARARDVTVADLLAAEEIRGRDVRLSGLMTKVERKIAKSSGAPWALVTLEDLTAAVDVTFFKDVYTAYGPELIEDGIVSIRGRANDRDGTITIMARELSLLKPPSPAGREEPIVIVAPSERLDEGVVLRLREVLGAYPGDTPVHMRILGRTGSDVLLELPHYRVHVDGSFIADLKGILGSGAVAS